MYLSLFTGLDCIYEEHGGCPIRSRNCLPFARIWVHSGFVGGVCVAHLFFSSYILLCVFTFWIPCCDVRYDFRIAMFGSSIAPVVCRGGSSLMYVICICFSILVSITFSCVFVLFFFVLCTRWWQFLWIDHIWLPLQCSLTFNFRVIREVVFIITGENSSNRLDLL